jgi:hypothetical protein
MVGGCTLLLLILISCLGFLLHQNFKQKKLSSYQETEIIREFIHGISQENCDKDDYVLLKNAHLFSIPYSDRFEIPLHAWNIGKRFLCHC